jgi:hypothetical protein
MVWNFYLIGKKKLKHMNVSLFSLTFGFFNRIYGVLGLKWIH